MSARLHQIESHLAPGGGISPQASLGPAAAANDELLYGIGSATADLDVNQLRLAVNATLDKLGPRERVLILPPVSIGGR